MKKKTIEIITTTNTYNVDCIILCAWIVSLKETDRKSVV